MARALGRVCALAGLCFAQLSAGYAVTTSSAALEARTTHPSTNTACALASKASSSYLAAETGATHARIPAELAYDCLKSVPNYQEPALRLLNALRTYLEFQSNKEYLRKPPSGYLFPAVDLDAELDTIQANVERGVYGSEYDMQLDIISLLASARDGHLTWSGDLLGAFVFEREVGEGLGLVALSVDGIEQPQVYMAEDLVLLDLDAGQVRPLTTDYTPSPVTSIDGLDVVSFLLVQSMVGAFQDPDALWNQNFYQLGNLNVNQFFQPTYYPGPTTNITFVNGTTRHVSNTAVVVLPLDGVNTGDDAYAVFCSGALESSASSTTSAAASTSSAPATSTQASPSSPSVPLFPYPVIKHSDNAVAGYYLNGTGLTDVAVLQIQGFAPPSTDSDLQQFGPEFQSVVQKFLDAAVKSGKSKLIIDLQGNGGGEVVLGADTFAQLFPSVPPNSKSNIRDHLGFWIVGNVASANATAYERASDKEDEVGAESKFQPMAYQSEVTDDLRNFSDFQSYYGPNQLYGGNFSAFFQDNYTNSDDTVSDGGIIITGTNNRTGFRQPFAAQDIVVLYDGFCASTCTVFSEYLKSYGGVQSIVIGGRPQNGPMQGVGGTKGSQVFEYVGNMDTYVGLFQSPENNLIGLANGTIWENFTTEPITRAAGGAGGVNGRNHFRIGDESNTPLQYVYEAADCRLWWTPEMLYDPTFLWGRVATVAFQQRTGTQFNSEYCVQGSTGHPTSISGGWKNGTLGPQNVPPNATATVDGWKLDGKPLGSGSGSTGNSSGGNIKLVNDEVKQSSTDDAALASLKQTCASYTGDKWLIKLICNAVGS